MKKIPIYGVGTGLYALVDNEDYQLVNQYRWHLHDFGYAITKPRIGHTKPTIRMHRLIMGAASGQQIDHINGDKLDNRKSNLRFCSQMENMWNRSKVRAKSGFKGVRWHKRDNAWRAEITCQKTTIFIGHFKSKEEAAYVRDQFAIYLHGQYAFTNLLRGECR